MNTTYIVALSITLLICFVLWTKGNGRIRRSFRFGNTPTDDFSQYEKPADTIFFKVTDDKGVSSSVHDSGIDPKDLPAQIYVLKKEITNKKIIELSTPLIIEYGRNLTSLEKKDYISGNELQTFDDHFLINISSLE